MRAAALLGLAAGDVFGVGVEGYPPAHAGALVGALPAPGAMWSDDTQQALVLAHHLLTSGGLVARSFGEALRRPDLPHRGIGPGFAAFLRSGEPQRSAGNGAAMRSAPLGIRFELPGLVDAAIEAGMVTHADPRGVAAGVAVAVAVRLASEGVRGADLLADVANEVTDAEHRMFADHGLVFGSGDRWHTMSDAIRSAASVVGETPEGIAAAVGARAAATSASGSASGTDAYAAASVVTAITVAAGPIDPIDAVVGVVSLGGDADTMGAMTGAIVAAATGFEDWPWEVPKRGLLLDIGHRLATGRDAVGLPDPAEMLA